MSLRCLVLVLLLLSCNRVVAALPEGIAGPWYNPQQSGHGLSISLAEQGSRGVVIWHAYDPDGAPLTLYVDANVAGRELGGPAYAPRGMRFGEFDPAALDLPRWGEVRIRFEDCDRATLDWQAVDPAYGNGSLPIERLAKIASLDCVLPPANAIASGLYLGRYPGAGLGQYNSALGVVDGEGRLWALSGRLDGSDFRFSDIPGPSFLSSFAPLLFLSDPLRLHGDGTTVVRQLVIDPNWASGRGLRRQRQGEWQPAPDDRGRFPAVSVFGLDEQVWEPAPPSVARLLQPIDGSTLAGDYTYELRGQFFGFVRPLRIAADGRACLGDGTVCDYRGHIRALEGAQGLIDFRLRRQGSPRFKAYEGRGWIDDSALGRRLVLLGDNGSNGFALVARRTETRQ